MSRFSAWRRGSADLGMGSEPIWTCHRRMTCPGDTSWVAAAVVTAASSSGARRFPIGLQASVRMPSRSCTARIRDCGSGRVHLVDGRRDSGVLDDPCEVRLGEVGDADGPDQPVLLEPYERAPGLDVEIAARVGPVDELEVEVVEAEPIERSVDGRDGVVVGVMPSRDLAGHENLVAGETRSGPRPRRPRPRSRSSGSVDQAVTGLEGGQDGRGAVPALEWVGAEADGGNGAAVVEDVRRGLAMDQI